MRNTVTSGAAAVVFVLSAINANAMGTGGGNLSPDASPYAVLEPQTLSPAPMTEGLAALTDEDAQPSSCHHSRALIHGVWHRIEVCR
jgi:hypothetical protein